MWEKWIALIHDPRCVVCDLVSRTPLCSPCARERGLITRSPEGLPIVSLGPYEEPLSSRVRRLKYNDETVRVARLASALCAIFPLAWNGAVMIPVPLHPERLVERGFNQSALLVRGVAGQLGHPTDFSSLRRVEATGAQARANHQQRHTNVANSFVSTRHPVARRVVLVDDVATSGATIDSCARSIARAGDEPLGALTICLGGNSRAISKALGDLSKLKSRAF